MIEESAAFFAELRSDFGQPDGRLDGFHLAEERPDATEFVVAPMLEQAGRLGRHVPLARVRQVPPEVDAAAQLVDDRRRVVLLAFARKPLSLVEDKLALLLPALLRLGDRGDELGAPSVIDDPVGGLTALVELPVSSGVLVGRVQDRLFEESIGHAHPMLVPDRAGRCAWVRLTIAVSGPPTQPTRRILC